jgi:hypothetical protein
MTLVNMKLLVSKWTRFSSISHGSFAHVHKIFQSPKLLGIPKIKLNLETEFVIVMVPAETRVVVVQLNALSLVSAKLVPFHSLSSKIMTSPGLMLVSATNAILSLPSALNPTNAMLP